jgi:hypothetical protein
VSNKNETKNDAEILNGLVTLYNEACDCKDYDLCDRIRSAINAHLFDGVRVPAQDAPRRVDSHFTQFPNLSKKWD